MRGSVFAAVALAFCLFASPAAAAWQPDEPSYGVGQERNVPVEMDEGTTIYADVYYPTDEKTGEAASGKFPVAMMITPYGKAGASATGQISGENEGGVGLFKSLPALVRRGYINVVTEIRGTGRSEGSFQMLDPQQGKDGAALVDWASKLPNSSGKVGMYGPSYMGIIQFLTAGELGRHSPLKAMIPVVAPNDAYRELLTSGGILAAEADVPLLAVFVALPLLEPFLDQDVDPGTSAESVGGRPQSILQSLLPLGLGVLNGEDVAFDEDFWLERSPASRLEKVVRNKIPALLVGGWHDVFQRGSLMNYAALQNIAAGRRATAPMRKRQPITNRYQVLMGPWSHVVAGEGFGLERMALRWSDHYLKGEPTGVERVKNPLHLWDLTRQQWIDRKHYPLVEAPAKSFYLGGGGTLTDSPSAESQGADTLPYTGLSSPCALTTEQYSLGAAAVLLGAEGNPCLQEDSTTQAAALTYTTEPFDTDSTVAGPIDATIFANSTRPEVELVATIEDVSPSGSSKPLTSGALLGSFRALDQGRTWFGANGNPLLPHHPYTRASVAPVPTGEVTRFDIEIPPTFATIAAGHSLRVTVASSDTPHLMPTPTQAANLAGGIYSIQRNSAASSFINVPIAPADDLDTPCKICVGHIP